MSNSPYCECEGNTECGVCITEREDAEAAVRWAKCNPIRCICPDTVGHHTLKCLKQDWTRNKS